MPIACLDKALTDFKKTYEGDEFLTRWAAAPHNVQAYLLATPEAKKRMGAPGVAAP